MIIATSDHVDLTKAIPDSTWNFIESLLETSLLDERQRKYFLIDIEDMDLERSEKVIVYLKENQQNPVEQRGTYGMTELSVYLKKKCNEE